MTWYTIFFTDLANSFWRGAVQPSQTIAEIDFVVGLGAGPRVLDAPCGSGRHSIELARRGYTVTGLDISEEAIAFARASEPSLDWRQGDVASLASQNVEADLAICMGNSFGYLDHAGSERFLADLAAVAPVLVLDYSCAAESLLPGLPGEIRMSAGGVDMVAANSYDVASGRLLIDFTFTDGERTQRSTCVQHVYTAGELARMLNATGFGSVELFGDTDGGAFGVGSHGCLPSPAPDEPEIPRRGPGPGPPAGVWGLGPQKTPGARTVDAFCRHTSPTSGPGESAFEPLSTGEAAT